MGSMVTVVWIQVIFDNTRYFSYPSQVKQVLDEPIYQHGFEQHINNT